MKKLINAPDAVVADALRGVQAAHGDRVRVTFDPYCVVRADAPVQGTASGTAPRRHWRPGRVFWAEPDPQRSRSASRTPPAGRVVL